ncbi:MAG TPA: hypothetical protein VFU78_19870 [Thermomicrobiales bacterium]|nr:hypothetical protein [Thermomicrobiales bacterium]
MAQTTTLAQPRPALVRALRPAAGGAQGLRAAGVVTLLYLACAIAFTWPLAAGLGDHLTSLADPLTSAWKLRWGQDQLLHAPLALFNAPTFYPYPRSYLFDELLIGNAILALPLRVLTSNPVALYNLTLLANLTLSALAMYALARRLGAARVGAFAAGLIYAFAPLHLDHLTHLALLAGQYFPLIILLLDRLCTVPRWYDALFLAAALAMQALSEQYYGIYLLFVVGGFVVLRLAQDRRRGHWPPRATWGYLAAAGALALLPVLPFILGYRLVRRDYGFARTLDQAAYYSANLASFITADPQNWLWGHLTAPLRDFGTYTFERNLFPGLLALALAALGALTAWRKPLAQYLLLLGLGSAVLALGPNLYLTADNKSLLLTHLPYGFLYFHLPGFDSMRVPARFGILCLLSIAGLASLGLTCLLDRVRALRWRSRAVRNGAAVALTAVVIGGIGVESVNVPYTPVAVPAVPAVYRWLAAQPRGVVLELPFVIPDHGVVGDVDQYYTLYSHQPTVNGAANIVPKGYQALELELRQGPTRKALAILQGLGVTDIVVHAGQLDPALAASTLAFFSQNPDLATLAARFGADSVYRLAPTDRFQRLRALIPPSATIYLARGDPTGAYGGMLARVLAGNPVYSRARVWYGAPFAGLPQPDVRYDYGILYRGDDPAAAGFAGGRVIWEDDVVQVYQRAIG